MAATDSKSYTFVVNSSPLGIISGTPPPATVGIPYSFNFLASGGTPPYTWVLVPSIPGLSLDPASGILNGTPTVAGSTPITVTVTDSAP